MLRFCHGEVCPADDAAECLAQCAYHPLTSDPLLLTSATEVVGALTEVLTDATYASSAWQANGPKVGVVPFVSV